MEGMVGRWRQNNLRCCEIDKLKTNCCLQKRTCSGGGPKVHQHRANSALSLFSRFFGTGISFPVLHTAYLAYRLRPKKKCPGNASKTSCNGFTSSSFGGVHTWVPGVEALKRPRCVVMSCHMMSSCCRGVRMCSESWSSGVPEAVPWCSMTVNSVHIYIIHIYIYTSSTAQGGGGSFKHRKPIGEIGCCESPMAEQKHWWIELSNCVTD